MENVHIFSKYLVFYKIGKTNVCRLFIDICIHTLHFLHSNFIFYCFFHLHFPINFTQIKHSDSIWTVFILKHQLGYPFSIFHFSHYGNMVLGDILMFSLKLYISKICIHISIVLLFIMLFIKLHDGSSKNLGLSSSTVNMGHMAIVVVIETSVSWVRIWMPIP